MEEWDLDWRFSFKSKRQCKGVTLEGVDMGSTTLGLGGYMHADGECSGLTVWIQKL